jgi:hypothetical protein
MLTDLWPLAFMLGLFGILYVISLALKALGIEPSMSRRPGIPFVPEASRAPRRISRNGQLPRARMIEIQRAHSLRNHCRLIASDPMACQSFMPLSALRI